MGFDLVDQPWVVVSTGQGAQEVSLRDALVRAGEFRGVVGDTPEQEAAVVRLLVTLVGRASIRPWDRMWEAGLPGEEIGDYLDRWRGRFDLYDPDAPFLQVPGLVTKGAPRPAAPVLQPGGRLSATVAGPVPSGGAVRGLLAVLLADTAGISPAGIGDPRASKGKVYPTGAGWGVLAGLHYLTGDTLAETLLLNLTPAFSGIPAWERPAPTVGEDRTPDGTADLYTWASRWVLLDPDADHSHCTTLTITNGLRTSGIAEGVAGREAGVALDPMVRWVFPKAGTITPWRARTLQTKPLWAVLAGVLSEGYDRPGVLEALVDRITAGVIDPAHPVTLHRVTTVTDIYSTTVSEVIHDTVPATAGTLTATGPDTTVDLLTRIAQAARALGDFAGNLALAGGGGRDSSATRTATMTALALEELDEVTMWWLRTVSRAGDATPEDLIIPAVAVLRALVDEMCAAAPAQAWVGRDTPDGHRINLHTAQARFWWRMGELGLTRASMADRHTTPTP